MLRPSLPKEALVRLTLCIALALTLSSGVADAAPFTWVVTGQITNDTGAFDGPYDGLLQVGQSYTWTLNMESSSPDLDPSPTCGHYTPITSMTFTSGSVSLSRAVPSGSQDYLINAGGCGDIPPGTSRIRSDFGNLALSLNFFFPGPASTLFLTPPAAFASLDLFYPFLPPVGMPIRNASASLAVPEPAASSLLFLALAGALRRRLGRHTPRE
jgi:hypothetical protein